MPPPKYYDINNYVRVHFYFTIFFKIATKQISKRRDIKVEDVNNQFPRLQFYSYDPQSRFLSIVTRLMKVAISPVQEAGVLDKGAIISIISARE